MVNTLGIHLNHLSSFPNDDFVAKAWSYQFVFVNQYSHASLNLGSLWGMSNLAFHNDYHVPRKTIYIYCGSSIRKIVIMFKTHIIMLHRPIYKYN